MTEIIAVRFKTGGKEYYFDPRGMTVKPGDQVVIETAKGPEFGVCYQGNTLVEDDQVVQPLRPLLRLATDKEKMSYRGCSASEFLQCILSDVALNTNRANVFYKSFSDISGTIDMQRISISGVDEDEEAVNLVKYQNGYNLASRMIQTLTEIYDRLILQTGV